MDFTGFTSADFAAFEQKKWQSHAFNLERLQVKQKLEALGKRIGLLGADGTLLEQHVSAESPVLWNQHRVDRQYLFFSRNEAAKKELDAIVNRERSFASMLEDPSPLRNHIFLHVTIDNDHVEVGLKLHVDARVDRDNLLRKCNDFFAREKILQRINGLPAGFCTGMVNAEQRQRLDDEQFQKLIADFADSASWLTIHRDYGAQDPIVGEGAFADRVADDLRALLPLMQEIAWTRENDFLEIGKRLADNVVRQKSKGLKKNDRVRVLRGLLAGQAGVVQSVDGKGALKVLVGKMTIKLAGEDVTKL